MLRMLLPLQGLLGRIVARAGPEIMQPRARVLDGEKRRASGARARAPCCVIAPTAAGERLYYRRESVRAVLRGDRIERVPSAIFGDARTRGARFIFFYRG